jgi:hypothetical protein
MRKMMMTLVAMLTIAATGKAMSYEQARNEALFLTDKMAYELNLNDAQYEAAYEINLDYLMGVTSYDDVYSTYWERRNLDMSYILFDWQWQAFCAATYFYRPLYWDGGYWHFAIYARYPHRDYFYFGRPVFYASYRGGHAWHVHGGHGYYYGHRDHYRPAGHSHFGMLDRWNRGDYRGHHSSGQRHSSTRTTADGRRFGHNDNGGRNHNDGRDYRDNRGGNRPSGNGGHNSGNNDNRGGNSSNGRSFGHSGNNSSTHSSSNSSHSSNVGSHSGHIVSGNSNSNRFSRSSSGSFSGSHSSTHSSGSFSAGSSRPSHSSGSFSSGSSTRSSGSFSGSHSGGSRTSSSGSHGGGHSSGGRSFGGRR